MSVLVWVVCSTAVRPLPCQLSSCDNSGDRIATSQPFLHPLPLHEYNFLFILIHPAACGPAWGREQRGGEDEGITRMGQTLVRSMASSPAPPPSQNAGSNSVDRNPSPDQLSLCGWTFLKASWLPANDNNLTHKMERNLGKGLNRKWSLKLYRNVSARYYSDGPNLFQAHARSRAPSFHLDRSGLPTI